MPYSKGMTDYSFTYEKNDIDFDIGLVAGYKFNRNIGIFGEGRYLKYFGIDAYELKAGINVTIFQMPNKKAKQRKQERIKKNEYLKRHGRTRKQIERFKRRKNENR